MASARDKDIGAQPVRQSCSCGLRVKALERLCEKLLILPTEIESLKERVYKIEFITRKKKGALREQKVTTSFQKVIPMYISIKCFLVIDLVMLFTQKSCLHYCHRVMWIVIWVTSIVVT